MDFTAFSEYMVCKDDIKKCKVANVNYGYEFQVRYPTYRGTYLCNIEELIVKVDGKVIDNKDIRLGLNGKWFLMSELPELFKEYWFTGKPATLRVLDDNELAAGKHEVFVEMKHKIPYTGYFGNFLVVDSKCTQTLNVAE